MYLWIVLSSLLFLGCASKAPIQEMSDARSALVTAQRILATDAATSKPLQQDKDHLEKATLAIDKQDFNRAKNLAKKAKKQAQVAVKEQQRRESQHEL